MKQQRQQQQHDVEYNAPDTRARIKALRQSRKSKTTRQTSRVLHSLNPAVRLHHAIRNPLLKTRMQKIRMKRTTLHRTKLPQRKRTHNGSRVKPAPKRMLLHWLQTGQLFSLILFLAALGVIAYLFTSPRFVVRGVAVEGNTLVRDEIIANLANLYGESIWFVDTKAAMQRIQDNPYIEQTRVSVALPDRVVIRIVERQPELQWKVGNVHYLVDGTGKVLEVAQTVPTTQTLVVEDTTHQTLQPHDTVDADAVKLAHALSVRLPTEVALNPLVIGWNMGLGVYIKTDEGQMVIFGRQEQLDTKLALLRHLRDTQTAFTYLDLRPSNPFYQNRPAEHIEPSSETEEANTEHGTT